MLFAGNSVASAQSIYYGAHGGLNINHSADLELSGTTFDIDLDPGFAIGGFVGYEFGSGLRAEGELAYRLNDVETFTGISGSGDVSSFAFMANAFYDFDFGSSFVPYVGGGIGAARLSFSDAGVVGIPLVDGDDVVFAYQLGAGIGFQVSPRLTVTADYRYFATADGEFSATAGGTVFDGEYSNSTILIGVRTTF